MHYCHYIIQLVFAQLCGTGLYPSKTLMCYTILYFYTVIPCTTTLYINQTALYFTAHLPTIALPYDALPIHHTEPNNTLPYHYHALRCITFTTLNLATLNLTLTSPCGTLPILHDTMPNFTLALLYSASVYSTLALLYFN